MAEFETEPDSEEKLSRDETIARLQQILDGLKEVVENLHDNIEVIESDPLTKLRLDAESKATTLEAEVKRLREDLKSIKDLLGPNLEKKKPPNPKV
jgi:t-SNARE complex subunit (syntaxin)